MKSLHFSFNFRYIVVLAITVLAYNFGLSEFGIHIFSLFWLSDFIHFFILFLDTLGRHKKGKHGIEGHASWDSGARDFKATYIYISLGNQSTLFASGGWVGWATGAEFLGTVGGLATYMCGSWVE